MCKLVPLFRERGVGLDPSLLLLGFVRLTEEKVALCQKNMSGADAGRSIAFTRKSELRFVNSLGWLPRVIEELGHLEVGWTESGRALQYLGDDGFRFRVKSGLEQKLNMLIGGARIEHLQA